ncbi:MAG: hypothetical protein ACOCVY_02905 [Patescibacteria group bacterium]
MVGISGVGRNFDVYVDALDDLCNIRKKEEEVIRKLENKQLSEREKDALKSVLRQIGQEKKRKLDLFI